MAEMGDGAAALDKVIDHFAGLPQAVIDNALDGLKTIIAERRVNEPQRSGGLHVQPQPPVVGTRGRANSTARDEDVKLFPLIDIADDETDDSHNTSNDQQTNDVKAHTENPIVDADAWLRIASACHPVLHEAFGSLPITGSSLSRYLIDPMVQECLDMFFERFGGTICLQVLIGRRH